MPVSAPTTFHAPPRFREIQTRLAAFAARLETEPWLRAGVLAAAAIASILMIGYHYSAYDQSIHIPFLKAWSNPALYANDPFLKLRFAQDSFFWFFFLPFYRLGVLEPVLFATHLIAIYLTFQTVWTLGLTLFEDSLSALVGVLALALPHLDWVGFPIIEFNLLNRTVVLPFLLMALTLYLRGRRMRAFFLLGLMYNLHVISVNFVLTMLLAASLGGLNRTTWRRSLVELGAQFGIFILAAAPVLIWRLSSARPLDWTIRPDWLAAVGGGFLYHIFYLFGGLPYSLLTNLNGLTALGLFYFAQHNSPAPRHAGALRWMASAIVMLLGMQFAAARWLPLTFWMELQIARAGTLLVILSTLYLAHFLVQQARRAQDLTWFYGLVASVFCAGVVVICAPLAWVGQRMHLPAAWGRGVALAGIGSTLVAICIVGLGYGVWLPGIYITPSPTPWIDAQAWAKDHTPQEAVFITPPQRFGAFEPDWRVFSERGSVATITDLLSIAYNPEYLAIWQPRFAALAPGVLEQFDGDFFKNKARIAQAYRALSDAALLDTACRFGADYLVVEKPDPRPWTLIYANEEFAIYDLRPVKACR